MKIFILSSLMLLVFVIPCQSQMDTITGHYCYTYADSESLTEGKEMNRTLTLRNAIESYKVFLLSSSVVKNFQLTS